MKVAFPIPYHPIYTNDAAQMLPSSTTSSPTPNPSSPSSPSASASQPMPSSTPTTPSSPRSGSMPITIIDMRGCCSRLGGDGEMKHCMRNSRMFSREWELNSNWMWYRMERRGVIGTRLRCFRIRVGMRRALRLRGREGTRRLRLRRGMWELDENGTRDSDAHDLVRRKRRHQDVEPNFIMRSCQFGKGRSKIIRANATLSSAARRSNHG